MRRDSSGRFTGGILTVEVIGSERLIARLRDLPSLARRHIDDTVKRLGFRLQRNVVTDWLTGRALRRRTGTLARNVNTSFTHNASESTARVGINLGYGRIWELTGVRAHIREIAARRKQALSWPGARHPVARVVQHRRALAPRPFLRPALQELRPTIRDELSDALTRAIRHES